MIRFEELGAGTGFIWKHQEQLFLVTNYHILGNYDGEAIIDGKKVNTDEHYRPNLRLHVQEDPLELNLEERSFYHNEDYDLIAIPVDFIPAEYEIFVFEETGEEQDYIIEGFGGASSPAHCRDPTKFEVKLDTEDEITCSEGLQSGIHEEEIWYDGMSGSPAYKDSKLVGIFSYGWPDEKSPRYTIHWKATLLEDIISEENLQTLERSSE
ncbi:MAG: hypothetical protein ABEJ83_01800 [Candidatus Nanohaloarchaea archaeon]